MLYPGLCIVGGAVRCDHDPVCSGGTATVVLDSMASGTLNNPEPNTTVHVDKLY